MTAYLRIRARSREAQAASDSPLSLPANIPGNNIRAMVGDGRAPYVDRAGQTWGSDTYCTGGSTFSAPARPILATFFVAYAVMAVNSSTYFFLGPVIAEILIAACLGLAMVTAGFPAAAYAGAPHRA